MIESDILNDSWAFDTNFSNQGVLLLKHQNSCTCVYNGGS